MFPLQGYISLTLILDYVEDRTGFKRVKLPIQAKQEVLKVLDVACWNKVLFNDKSEYKVVRG